MTIIRAGNFQTIASDSFYVHFLSLMYASDETKILPEIRLTRLSELLFKQEQQGLMKF